MGTTERRSLLKLTENPTRPLELRVHHLLRRCLQPGLTATVTATAVTATAGPATATGDAGGAISCKLVISHPCILNTTPAIEGSVECSHHPVQEVLSLSGGSLASLTQVSALLHNRHASAFPWLRNMT
jgi:hypothetical protein